MSETDLIKAAAETQKKAYAPYSKFSVGAAVLTKSGKVFTGCNVENISFGLTICAERSAVATAIASGEQEFEAIAITTDSIHVVMPCGACRQVLAEFNPDLKVITSTRKGAVEIARLSELLPRPKQGILETDV